MNDKQFETIIGRLDGIDKEIQSLKKMIETDVKGNCSKMGEHIDFVENIYETVKSPMYFVCNQVNKITGNQIADTEVEVDNE
jgi:archaellum component FlaC